LVARLYPRKRDSPIRPLNPARDLGQLADLIENAFSEELSNGGRKVLREIRFLSWLGPFGYLFYGTGSELDGMFTGLVWEHQGKVVGNVSVNRAGGEGNRWQISNVAVLDRFRRQGIGQKLVEAALDAIANRGGETAYLYVRDDNLPAVHMYSNLGFAQVDRVTELRLLSPRRPPSSELALLRPLQPSDQESLYDLVRLAEGAGQRWLRKVQRSHYVVTAEERLLKRVGGLITGEREARWGVTVPRGLDAAVSLRATRLWNLKPHRLRLWVHPDRRGQLETQLASDAMSLLSRQAPRPVWASLPACEDRATAALIDEGFRAVRTLILMRRQV
jgi:ribosomal protein S18 acetylase RimI-like enzyme